MTYTAAFQEIEKTKESNIISNLLFGLRDIEPDYNYLDKVVTLVAHRNSEIRRHAIVLLSNFCSPDLEGFYHDLIKKEPDSSTLLSCVNGLEINGTEQSFELLLDLFKKSRDGQVRSAILSTLRSIYLRNYLSDSNKAKLFKFIGNSYPFFMGYWLEIKKSKKTTLADWKGVANMQLQSNQLNVIFELDAEVDIQIRIEKMRVHFIRSVNVIAIWKNHSSSFSKYHTPREFYCGKGRTFSSLWEQTWEMRPDQYIDKIMTLVQEELLPELYEQIGVFKYLKKAAFNEFQAKQDEVLNKLFNGLDGDFLTYQFIHIIDIFEHNPDKVQYIDFALQKLKAANQKSFSVTNYLEERKNSI